MSRNEGLLFTENGQTNYSGAKTRSEWLELFKKSKDTADQIAALIATGEFDLAVKRSKASLMKNPGSPKSIYLLALSYAGLGKYDLANFYAGKLRTRQSSFDLSNVEAVAEYENSKFSFDSIDKSISLFEQSHEQAFDQKAAGLNLAYIALSLGNYEKAKSLFSQVANRCAKCRPSLLGLSESYYVLGQGDEALDILKELLDDSPKDDEILYRLANISYYSKSNKGAAAEYLRRIFAYSSKNSEYYKSALLLQRKIESEIR